MSEEPCNCGCANKPEDRTDECTCGCADKK